ncbi:uncharacterized protein PRCAT00004866001 [Priceomyces carsonii]|uniref:uncharacterized protein n=1 Tax=Priceomyces carsonii TaxID=28549 RepID=UPI002EDB0320|nr:unnamed protein product [Priceomyces carsonii]
MSVIPGLGTDHSIPSLEGSSAEKILSLEIPGKSEWRFEVPFRTILKLKVLQGIGEIFGTELPTNVEIDLTGVKYSLYAPLEEGCKIQYYSVPNKHNLSSTNEESEIIEYISEETSMNSYINLHMALEAVRQEVADHNLLNPEDMKVGPRTLIIGNRQSGKTALCKILSSYALKMDRTPVLVNLNPQDGVFSIPGSLTATPISDTFDLESVNGWGGSTTSGSTLHNPKQPLVKNYGFTNIKDNDELYKYQISRMGVAVMSRIEEDINVRNGGLIIDTPPLSIKDFNIIENIVSDFEVTVIVVIGNERLSIDLKKKLKHKLSSGQLNILKVPKSGGVVEVDDSFIRKLQEETIKEYFNGNFRTPLSPFKTEVDAYDYVIYTGVEALEFNSSLSFLPAGDSFTPEDSEMNGRDSQEVNTLEKYYSLVSEPSASNLDNVILAITQLPQKNKLAKDLLNTCVLGYVHVSKVDDTKRRMKVLLPFPGGFPRNILIATNIRYTE